MSEPTRYWNRIINASDRHMNECLEAIRKESYAAGHAAAVAKLREPSIEMLGAVAREENLDVTWEEQVKRYLRAAADALEAEKGEG